MNSEQRLAAYARQSAKLTPKQRRRVQHKKNASNKKTNIERYLLLRRGRR